MSIPTKQCVECGTVFQKKPYTSYKEWTEQRKYCSQKCSLKHTSVSVLRKDTNIERKRKTNSVRKGNENILWKGGQVKLTCFVCNKKYGVDRYRAETSKCCSKKCDVLYRQTDKFRLTLSGSQRNGISKEFYELTVTFAKFKNLLRRCARYNMWRAEILRRDNYICQSCNKRGGKLCVDHIRPFIAILVEFDIKSYEQALECEPLWDISNGETLCYPCHYKTPTFGSKVRQTLSATLSKKS